MPVVTICGTACVMCAGYIGFMCLTKSDLRYDYCQWVFYFIFDVRDPIDALLHSLESSK